MLYVYTEKRIDLMKQNNAITPSAAIQYAADTIRRNYDYLDADAVNGKLIVSWNCKDAVIAGINSMSKEYSLFRYVVTVNDDGTFYGYDIDEEKTAAFRGKWFSGSTSSSIGHMAGYRKEIAFGKNKDDGRFGIRTWEFSTKKIHGPVNNILQELGFTYKESAVTWKKLEGPATLLFMGIGAAFGAVGFFLGLMFLILGEPAGILAGAAVLGFGIVMFLFGSGTWKVPILSMKTGVLLLVSVIGCFWIAAFLFVMVAGSGRGL